MALEPLVVAKEGRCQQQLGWGEYKGLEASMRGRVGEEGIHTDAGRGVEGENGYLHAHTHIQIY